MLKSIGFDNRAMLQAAHDQNQGTSDVTAKLGKDVKHE